MTKFIPNNLIQIRAVKWDFFRVFFLIKKKIRNLLPKKAKYL